MALLNDIKSLKTETRIHAITPHILGSILENMFYRAMPKSQLINAEDAANFLSLHASNGLRIGYSTNDDIVFAYQNTQHERVIRLAHKTTTAEIGQNTRDTYIGRKVFGVSGVGYVRTTVGKNADHITFGDGTDRVFIGYNCRLVNIGQHSDMLIIGQTKEIYLGGKTPRMDVGFSTQRLHIGGHTDDTQRITIFRGGVGTDGYGNASKRIFEASNLFTKIGGPGLNDLGNGHNVLTFTANSMELKTNGHPVLESRAGGEQAIRVGNTTYNNLYLYGKSILSHYVGSGHNATSIKLLPRDGYTKGSCEISSERITLKAQTASATTSVDAITITRQETVIGGDMVKLNAQNADTLPSNGLATRILVQNDYGRVVYMSKSDFKTWLGS